MLAAPLMNSELQNGIATANGISRYLQVGQFTDVYENDTNEGAKGNIIVTIFSREAYQFEAYPNNSTARSCSWATGQAGVAGHR